MAYLTALADIARRTGFPVTETSGWRTRGHGQMGTVSAVVCHHTAGAATGDMPSLGVVTNGRAGLAGPLAHFGLGRSGRIYVVAAGLAYHAGAVLRPEWSNAHAVGIEAENTGTGQAWPAEQMRAYHALCAELCRDFGLPPAAVLAHREVCSPPGRKIDPTGINMPAFRDRVADLMAGLQEDDVTADEVWAEPVVIPKDLDALYARTSYTTRELLLSASAGPALARKDLAEQRAFLAAQFAVLAGLLGQPGGLTAEQARQIAVDAAREAVEGITITVHADEETL